MILHFTPPLSMLPTFHRSSIFQLEAQDGQKTNAQSTRHQFWSTQRILEWVEHSQYSDTTDPPTGSTIGTTMGSTDGQCRGCPTAKIRWCCFFADDFFWTIRNVLQHSCGRFGYDLCLVLFHDFCIPDGRIRSSIGPGVMDYSDRLGNGRLLIGPIDNRIHSCGGKPRPMLSLSV